jgi:iron complex outermembrane receptor protein
MTPYYTYVDDYIDARRIDGSTETDDFVYLQFVNQDAHIYGIDISGQLSLANNTEYGDFNAIGMINYVRGENESTDDNLYNMMPLNARFALEQAKGNWINILELELVDDKSDVSQVRNEVKTDGYGLLHLRSSYKWQQARFDFGIENIFDRFYNHPLGGAYLGQGKTMPELVAWGTPVPGMGRSIYAGVNIEF